MTNQPPSPAIRRPRGITALSVFFAVGALISLTAALALLLPGSFFEPIWRLNPRAHEGFARLGTWAPLLMISVSLACAASSAGLWRGRRWGYRLALGMLTVNLAGDIANVVLGTEPRAAVGIPIVALLLWYLSTARVRAYFMPVPTT